MVQNTDDLKQMIRNSIDALRFTIDDIDDPQKKELIMQAIDDAQAELDSLSSDSGREKGELLLGKALENL